MAKTTNKYWIYLENLRRSGATNMFGAAPYLEHAFGLSRQEARDILADWMRNYNRDDYSDELEYDDFEDEEYEY